MPLRNIFVITLTAIIALACYSVASKNRYANLFAEAMEVIDRDALQDVPPRDLFTSAMKGMMQELDEHSMYISGDLFTAIDEDMNQEFGGVGMYIENDPITKKLIVLAPIPDTPAFENGVQIGDEITEIDGTSAEGMERSEAIELLRGPKGEPVNVVFRRNEKLMAVKLVRAAIPMPSVSGDSRNADGSWNYVLKSDPHIGYIRLQQFGKLSAEEMADAVQEINGKVRGLILDLRNNTGGLLSAALSISDMFLGDEVAIVRTRGRNKKLIETYSSSSKTLLNPNIPMVVLINRNSASASEIVAGCLQDHNRAVIVGEQSWGKGTVQNLIPVERGRSALKLTISSFWRPSDRQIDRYDPEAKKSGVWGIQPNEGMTVEMSDDEIYANMRWRSYRDLEGLNPKGAKMWLQNVEEAISTDADPESEDTPEPEENDEMDATPKADSFDVETHIDAPLQRAREYFKSILNKAIAA